MRMPFIPKSEKEILRDAGFSSFFGMSFDTLDEEAVERINSYLEEGRDMDFYITKRERLGRSESDKKYVLLYRSRG